MMLFRSDVDRREGRPQQTGRRIHTRRRTYVNGRGHALTSSELTLPPAERSGIEVVLLTERRLCQIAAPPISNLSLPITRTRGQSAGRSSPWHVIPPHAMLANSIPRKKM